MPAVRTRSRSQPGPHPRESSRGRASPAPLGSAAPAWSSPSTSTTPPRQRPPGPAALALSMEHQQAACRLSLSFFRISKLEITQLVRRLGLGFRSLFKFVVWLLKPTTPRVDAGLRVSSVPRLTRGVKSSASSAFSTTSVWMSKLSAPPAVTPAMCPAPALGPAGLPAAACAPRQPPSFAKFRLQRSSLKRPADWSTQRLGGTASRLGGSSSSAEAGYLRSASSQAPCQSECARVREIYDSIDWKKR